MSVASDAAGDFIVVWTSYTPPAGGGTVSEQGQIYAASGANCRMCATPP